jgi:hypothetical protein
MVFFKFKLPPIELLCTQGGSQLEREEERQREKTLFWIAGVARMQISVLRKNLYSSGNI